MRQQWNVNEKKKKRIEVTFKLDLLLLKKRAETSLCEMLQGSIGSLWTMLQKSWGCLVREFGQISCVKRAKWRNRQWALAPFTPYSITWLIFCNAAQRVFLPGTGGPNHCWEQVVSSLRLQTWDCGAALALSQDELISLGCFENAYMLCPQRWRDKGRR